MGATPVPESPLTAMVVALMGVLNQKGLLTDQEAAIVLEAGRMPLTEDPVKMLEESIRKALERPPRVQVEDPGYSTCGTASPESSDG